uniref:Uncharacterized protein n=1 Tax=Anguilla anguilla TaxID=7936 RepID=A0A0E9XPV5_ANGAN
MPDLGVDGNEDTPKLRFLLDQQHTNHPKCVQLYWNASGHKTLWWGTDGTWTTIPSDSNMISASEGTSSRLA